MSRGSSSSRIALCGCGRIGRVHAGNLAGRADLLFQSRTPASADDFRRRFGGEVAADYRDVLASDVQAVVIATPPEMHCHQVLEALGAGKSVLVEKPLCTCPAEVEQIVAAAGAAAGRFLMVAENYYYKPSLAALRRAVSQGWVGAVGELSVRKLTRQEADGWKSRWGALLEGGIHFVALAADLADAALGASAPLAPDEVSAEFPGCQPGQPERHARLRLTYGSGLVVRLHYAWDTATLLRGTFQHSCLQGDGGRILFESNGLYLLERGRRGPRLAVPGLADLMGYRAMTDDFLGCLGESGRQPYSDLARARRDLGVVFAAYAHLGAR